MSCVSETRAAAQVEREDAKDGVVLGLGSNQGDSVSLLRRAVELLRSLSRSPLRVSSLYRSAPIGPPQEDFLNCAVWLDHPGDLFALLSATQRIELELGRVRQERWGPRTLDIDLLWAAGRTVGDTHLQVPHERLAERAFALLPLVELCPEAVDPRTERAYRDELEKFRSQRIERAGAPGWEKPEF